MFVLASSCTHILETTFFVVNLPIVMLLPVDAVNVVETTGQIIFPMSGGSVEAVKSICIFVALYGIICNFSVSENTLSIISVAGVILPNSIISYPV